MFVLQCLFLLRLSLNRLPIPVSNNNALVGSGIVAVAVLVPSTTMLSMRLFPVDEVAPLKTILNAAFGLLFSPAIAARLKTSGVAPNVVAGV